MAKPMLKLTGLSEMKARLAKTSERADNAAGAAGYRLCNDVMNDSVRRTPVDTGALRGSRYVTMPVHSGKGMQVEYGYGGPAKKYAVKVHEDLNAFHPVGEAKFLESAIDEHRPEALRKLGEYFNQAFERDAKPVAIGKTKPE